MAREITDPNLVARMFALPALSHTRVALRDPRHEFGNGATSVVSLQSFARQLSSPAPMDPRALFVREYALIRQALRCHRQLGVLTMAFARDGELLGQLWLKATSDKPRGALIGRHSMCDLAIPTAYSDVSLRHLAVLVQAIQVDEIRVRLIDLRTGMGFADETGRVLRGLAAEGSLFLRLGEVDLMLLVTRDDQSDIESAEDAYACIPERVFFDERGPGDLRPMVRRRASPGPFGDADTTHVVSKAGPLAVGQELCAIDELPAGRLVIRTHRDAIQRVVGQRALDRGILLGRYDRCDVGITDHPESRLSRVHLLVCRHGDDVLAVDTASTNGTQLKDREIRLERLADGTRLELAKELSLTWHDPD
ncbi:MAG: FHA domain-containing protein [Pseudomonadota bacterium]